MIFNPSTSTILKLFPCLISFAMAQRETEPIPKPASTADLIASVESSSITMFNEFRLTRLRSSANSITCRAPDPRSHMSSGIVAISEQQVRTL